MKSLFALAFAAVAAFAMPSQAAPVTEGVWQLENNTNHSLGFAGFYRYDAANASYDLYDFETNGADVKLTYDATAGTIDLAGKAYDTVDNRLVDFDLNYTGVTANADRVATGFMGAVGTFDGVDVISKPNGTGFSLYLDPANENLINAGLTGHGWLNTDAGHFGDFHFNGYRIGDLGTSSGTGSSGGSVPAPGGIAFLMLGAIAIRRMKKQNA